MGGYFLISNHWYNLLWSVRYIIYMYRRYKTCVRKALFNVPTLSANFCPVAFFWHSTTLPLMPRPRTVSEILKSCVMGVWIVTRLPRGCPITDIKSLLMDKSPASMVKERQQLAHLCLCSRLKFESLKNWFPSVSSPFSWSILSTTFSTFSTFLDFFMVDRWRK